MFGRETRNLRVPDHARPDPVRFVCRDRHPDARATDEDPFGDSFSGDRFGHFPGKVGVVTGFFRGRSDIEDLMLAAAPRAKPIRQLPLELKSRMIGADRQLHGSTTLTMTLSERDARVERVISMAQATC